MSYPNCRIQSEKIEPLWHGKKKAVPFIIVLKQPCFLALLNIENFWDTSFCRWVFQWIIHTTSKHCLYSLFHRVQYHQLRARRALMQFNNVQTERHYCCTKSMAIMPFLFSVEHLWTVLMPVWLSADHY